MSLHPFPDNLPVLHLRTTSKDVVCASVQVQKSGVWRSHMSLHPLTHNFPVLHL